MTGKKLNEWTDVNCSQNIRNSSVISVASQIVLELKICYNVRFLGQWGKVG